MKMMKMEMKVFQLLKLKDIFFYADINNLFYIIRIDGDID